MTLFIDFRTAGVGGAVGNAKTLEIAPASWPHVSPPLGDTAIAKRVEGKNLLFATHGFNVHRDEGVRALGRLDSYLRNGGKLSGADVFIGVLWPGDFWIPAINYPFEGDDAIDCGKRLAAYCARQLKSAQSYSFLSHSLGARLVLEAVKHLHIPANSVCLTAAAIDRDCLRREYAKATGNAKSISILASHEDEVLKLAFPIGNPIYRWFQDAGDHFQLALGYDGPPRPAAPPINAPWQIPDGDKYGHGSYLPPSSQVPPPPEPDPPQWHQVADFMANAFNRLPQSWPR
ncbi:MAG TPA: alpha/beta hydrolase [Dongiaceae bacterium]|nr:alpha/beta hydrolase [Dongiaceae bacterium]